MNNKREDLEKVRESMRVFAEHEAKLARELGEEPLSDLFSRHEAEDQHATLFDRLSAAEMLDLYHNDPERWQQVIEAKEREGLRKLFEGRLP